MVSIREHLIFKALAALSEVKEAAASTVIQPTLTLRFCLAFLYAQGAGDRCAYDDFWRDMQDEWRSSTDGGRYMRRTQLTTCMNGIIDDLGFHASPAVMECLRRAGSRGAALDFWIEVQRQLDDGRPMPRKFKRG